MNINQKNVTKFILKRSKKELILKVITSVFVRGCYLIIPVFWSMVINEISHKNFKTSCIYIAVCLGLAVLNYLLLHWNIKTCYQLRARLFLEYTDLTLKTTQRNSMYSLSRFSLGEYTNITNTDIDVMASFFADNIIRIVQMLELVIIFSYFLSISSVLFAFTVFLSLLMFLFLIKKNDTISDYNTLRKRKLDSKTGAIHDFFGGLREIKGFHIFHKVNKNVNSECSSYAKSYTRYHVYAYKVLYITLGTIEFFRYLVMFYGVYLISQGSMEIGSLLLIYSYYGQICTNFEIAGTFFQQYADFKVSLNRFGKLFQYQNQGRKINYLPKHPYEGRITFRDVLYGNREDPILNHVSFELQPNSINVITGKPGSGKTGIMDLLLFMNRKHSGDILIDQDPIEKINPELYYKEVASCRKNPFFFKLSIKDNFLMINKDFNKAIEICRLLGIDKKISSLPDGYDTMLDDNNRVLSNEMRQLLSVARVFLKDPKIMLFDETLSWLDKNNQQIVWRLLQEMKKDHTIVLISREEEIIKLADHVVELVRSST